MEETSRFKQVRPFCSRRLMFNAIVIFLCSCIGSYIGLMVATTNKSQEIRKRYLDGEVKLRTPQIVNSYNIDTFGQVGYEIEDDGNQTISDIDGSQQNPLNETLENAKTENESPSEKQNLSFTTEFNATDVTTPLPLSKPRSLFGMIHFLDHADETSSVCCFGSDEQPGASFKFAAEDKAEFVLFNSSFSQYQQSTAISNNLQFHITPQLVTAISEEYFDQHISNMKYFAKHFPNRKVVVYDLGLTREQAFYLYTSPTYYYRHFEFSKYPQHVRYLKNFAWKAFLWVEVLAEFGAVAWFDADTLFQEDLDEVMKKYLKNRGSDASCVLFYSEQSNFTNFDRTHPDVYKYFPKVGVQVNKISVGDVHSEPGFQESDTEIQQIGDFNEVKFKFDENDENADPDAEHIYFLDNVKNKNLTDPNEIPPDEFISPETLSDERKKSLNVNGDHDIQYSGMFARKRKRRELGNYKESKLITTRQLQAGAVILFNSDKCRTNIFEWLLVCAATDDVKNNKMSGFLIPKQHFC